MRQVATVALLLALSVTTPATAEQIPFCPDLEILSFALFGPQTLAPGEIVGQRVSTIVRNAGSLEAGPYSVGLYLSTDAQITLSDQLVLGGREEMYNLDRQGIDVVPVWDELTIPPTWPVGPAYLGVLIDEWGAVAECVESNNTVAIPVMISSGGASVLNVPSTYTTIASAIAAATAGDTIVIDSGDYDEELVITKDLILIGAGADKTIIKCSTNDSQILYIDHADVVIDDLQFWSWPAGEFWLPTAIMAETSSVVIRNCRFVEIGAFNVEAVGGAVYIEGISIERIMAASDLGVRTFDAPIKFRNSYGGERIDHVFDLRGTSVGVIENNTIDGSPIHYSHGIRLMDSAVAVIRNNLIIGQHDLSNPLTHQPAGIFMVGDAFADIHDNTIHTFIYGIDFGNNADARIYNNTITDNIQVGVRTNLDWPGYDGSTPDLGGGYYLSPGNNTIRDNGPLNVRNRGPQTVWALWNHWGTTDSATIDGLLYDDDEDAGMGEVIFLQKGVVTSPGQNVLVQVDSIFKLLFKNVLTGGLTYVDPGQIGPPLPDGWRVVPSYGQSFFEIRTTAGFDDSVEVTVMYDETRLLRDESGLSLLHFEDGRWFEATSSLNPAANLISGMVASFSPFVLAEPLQCVDTDNDGFGSPGYPTNDCPTDNCANTYNPGQEDTDGNGIGDACCCVGLTGNVDGDPSGICDIGDLTSLIGYLFIPPFTPPTCPAEGNIDGEGTTDIGDLTALIGYLFIPPFTPPVECE